MAYKDAAKRKEYAAEYRKRNKDKAAAYIKSYNDNNRDVIRDKHYKRKYGLSLDAVRLMQEGGCGICGSTGTDAKRESLHIDHDHLTGKVRGILCSQCNTGLGKLGDSIEGLQRAIEYLQRNANYNSFEGERPFVGQQPL